MGGGYALAFYTPNNRPFGNMDMKPMNEKHPKTRGVSALGRMEVLEMFAQKK